MSTSEGVPRDEHGHIAISQVNLARSSPSWSPTNTPSRPAASAKVTGLQLGYESRCARPHAFDVMLGSQLGVGAYRALVEKRLDGVMVSVSRPARPELRPVRPARRPGDARDRRPLHRARQRFPSAGAVFGNVCERITRPTYSSMVFGGKPAASMTIGFSMYLAISLPLFLPIDRPAHDTGGARASVSSIVCFRRR